MGDSSLTFEDVLMEEGFIPKWLAQGEERGIKKGREEGREKVAWNLLKKGWGIEETAETAELAVEKVRLLAQNIR
jgi:predicted transposase YdaD